MKKILLVFFLISCFMSFGSAQGHTLKSDRDLVFAAVEDYVLGLYEVSPERIARSVDSTLHKIGYYEYGGESYDHVPMTYNELYDLAGTWNSKGDQANDESIKEIIIYDVHDKTASAKLIAKWGIDFMHLSKVDGQWKIMNIMWQSPPK